MSSASDRELIDRSDKLFASPRKVRFLEMEYGVPFDAVPDACSVAVRCAEINPPLPVKPMFPIEVRSSAADDIPLSTAHGRGSRWIAVHQYVGVPYEAYFQGVEKIMNDYAGRPHWGKMHYQNRRTPWPIGTRSGTCSRTGGPSWIRPAPSPTPTPTASSAPP